MRSLKGGPHHLRLAYAFERKVSSITKEIGQTVSQGISSGQQEVRSAKGRGHSFLPTINIDPDYLSRSRDCSVETF
ncbi:hypothetical protein MHL32_12580 [Roseomonas mucosa]|nr:hypothetical protein [Roseomonas mucosa]MCG7352535.1 hypothetical protein [Roseomonas mucosa]